MTFFVKRTGDVCKPNRVVRFTLRDKTQQWYVIESHLLSTITRMHRKRLLLAVVCDRFLFMQASHLNWPLTSRPVAMLHVGLYRATITSMFHSSSMNVSAASPYSKLHNIGLIYTSSRLATVYFHFCRRFLHHFLNLSGHFLSRPQVEPYVLAFRRKRGNWKTQAHTGRLSVDYAALSNNRCVSDQLGTFGRQRIHVHLPATKRKSRTLCFSRNWSYFRTQALFSKT